MASQENTTLWILTEVETHRLWSKIDRRSDNECWLWLASLTKGYGQCVIRRKRWIAHRAIYTLLRGPIPKGKTLDHLCMNKLCVNPAHLEIVDAQENVRRYYRSKTHCSRGHSFEDAYRHTGGRRKCRHCANERRRKRLCPAGHPYDMNNTVLDSIGRPMCKACRK